MKKYLFLMFLLILYFMVSSKEETIPAFLHDAYDGSSTKTITLRFENGINSKELVKEFNNYKNEYLVQSIKLENNLFDVKCTSLDKCIESVFNEENSEFNQKYLTNGFKIDEITFISYDEMEINELQDNSAIYVNK